MMRLELTDRDRKLFQTINDYGLLTTKQIRKIVFRNIDESTVLRRLRKLKNKNYLNSHEGLPKGKLVWTLTLKARQIINSDLEVTVNKNQLEHDILISEIRLRLEKQGVCSFWMSGHRLKQMSSSKNNSDSTRIPQQVPDSIFSVQTNSGIKVVALELELVSKAKRRYRDILRNYSHNSKINWVWYVLVQKSLGSFLSDEANSIKRTDSQIWLYTSPLSSVLDPNSSVMLTNPKHSMVLLKPAQPDAQAQGSQK